MENSPILAQRLANPAAPPQVAAVPWISSGALQISVGVLIDNLSAVMLFIVTAVALLVQIYSTGYMDHEPEFGFSKFFAYLSLFTASMLGLVLSTNFVQIYMCWELVGLSSYLLIGFWYYKKSAADAAKKAFVVTRFGDAGFLLGIIVTYWLVKSVDFVGPNSALDKMAQLAQTHPQAVAIAAILIFCGAVGKSAQFPLHIWLPDAMEGPTPVSALIHAATMVAAGVYLVSRCFTLYQASPDASAVVGWIGGITAIVAASIGVVQSDIKRVFAYSTVSQLGYMFMALGVGTQAGLAAGNFHLLTHAFFKALLFLGSGSIIHVVNTNNMWKMGGLRKAMPITHFTMLCGCLALSGLPPFAGFWSKDAILGAAIHTNAMFWPAILGYIAAFLTGFYVWRLYFVTFGGEFRGGDPRAPHDASVTADAHGHDAHGHDAHGHDAHGHDGPLVPHETPANMWFPLVILAMGAVGLGFLNADALHMEYYTHFMLAGHEAPTADAGNPWPLLGLSTLIAVAGTFLAFVMYGKDPKKGEEGLKRTLGPVYGLLENKYYMDEMWSWLLTNTMFLGATVANWFDATVIDGVFVRGTGAFTYFVAQLLREEHSGRLQQYAMMIVVALCVIIVGVGVAEPHFVLNPAQFLNLLGIPTGAPGAGVPLR